MKYALDFDGVLCERHGIPTEEESILHECPPMAGALDAVKWLQASGHELYIHTTHEPLSEVRSWLEHWGFPELRITNIKESGTKAYIDDRAIRFTNWQDIRKLLE